MLDRIGNKGRGKSFFFKSAERDTNRSTQLRGGLFILYCAGGVHALVRLCSPAVPSGWSVCGILNRLQATSFHVLVCPASSFHRSFQRLKSITRVWARPLSSRLCSGVIKCVGGSRSHSGFSAVVWTAMVGRSPCSSNFPAPERRRRPVYSGQGMNRMGYTHRRSPGASFPQ